MTWKKQFASRVRLSQLPDIGPFKIANEPEPLGKGQFRVVLVTKDGKKKMLRTYESTIGDILQASFEGYVKAFPIEIDGKTYINFKAVS